MATKKIIVLTVVLALVVVAALSFLLPQLTVGPSARSGGKVVEVTIPQRAYEPPSGWRGGLVFSESYFTPNTVTIAAGDTVRWVNSDTVDHTATSQSGPAKFDSRAIPPRGSWQFTFTVVGEYQYNCSFHPWAAGKVIVK